MTDPSSINRRLAAILAADVVGYGSLMERDETQTLARLKARRQQILAPLLQRYSGRIVKLMGDGVLIEFASAVNAVHCAQELQEKMAKANQAEPESAPIFLRIGINVGDVVVEGTDLYGDGVNVAARLESIAEPGTIYISHKVQEELRGKTSLDFEDLGDTILKNIARSVRIYRLGNAAPTSQRDSSRLKDVPTLSVLPFKNLTGEPGDQHLADGLTEDLKTELSRFKTYRLTERGAGYLVEGSVRRAGETLRISVQLNEAATGKRIWSDKYDIIPDKVSATQDSAVAAIVAAVEERMVSVAAAAAKAKPEADRTAFDYLYLGRELCNAYSEPDAIPFFEKAIEIDPNLVHPHSWIALALAVSFMINPDQSLLTKASLHARKALSLDSNDPTVHHANGMVLAALRDHEGAGNHYERAVALNPADIQIRADRANWLRYGDRLDEALSAIDDIIRRNPVCPPWFWAVRGEILFDLKRYQEALNSFANAKLKPYRELYVAAAHAYLGDLARAKKSLEDVRRQGFNLTEEAIRLAKAHVEKGCVQRLIEGLRLAGAFD